MEQGNGSKFSFFTLCIEERTIGGLSECEDISKHR